MTLAGKAALANALVVMGLTLLEHYQVLRFAPLLSYQTHKVLHILGVVLFMGNMIVGPFWFLYAFYSKNKELLLFANKLLQLTDICLTIPGLFVTVINGLFLADFMGGTAEVPWLYYSVILLIIMGIISIPLIYFQEKMYECIDKEPENRLGIKKYLYAWSFIGTAVMIPPSIVFYLMIVKTI